MDAAAAVEIEDAEVVEVVVAVEVEVEEVAVVAVIEIIKTLVVILARTWTISSNLNIPGMDIENVIQIIEMQEDIREAAVVEVEVEVDLDLDLDLIVEILAQTTIRIIVKVTVKIRIINSRNIPVRETRIEVTIEAVGTIRTGGKAEEEGEVEFKVDGIKVPILLVGIVINMAAIVGAETSTEDAISRIFLTMAKVSHEKR